MERLRGNSGGAAILPGAGMVEAAMLPDDCVRLEVAECVAIVTLNRPQVLNAIDRQLAQAFLATLEKIVAAGTEVRAVLLKGEGKAFCAGGDIAQFATSTDYQQIAGQTMGFFHPAMQKFIELPMPTVVQLHGAVSGAGLSLAMACDFALAAETARFSFAYAQIGGTLDGSASWSLPRIVGLRKAKELALLSEPFAAAEALRLEIINRVVPAAELAAESLQLAKRLAAGPTVAFARMKRLLNDSLRSGLAEQLDAERAGFIEAAGTADFNEGMRAFFDKRAPVFKGR